MARAPARRAANRSKFGPGSAGARKVIGHDPQHDYAGDNKPDHGSPRQTGTRGAAGGTIRHFGSAPGAPPAPHLEGPQAGPGAAAHRYLGMSSEAYPSRSTPSGAPPKGMKVYREE